MRFSKEPSALVPKVESAVPDAALPGGEIEILGSHLGAVGSRMPIALIDGATTPVLLSRTNRMVIQIPEQFEAGTFLVQRNGHTSNSLQLKIARLIAEDLHPVGNPAVDAQGNIFVTFSGPRGQKTPTSVYRIGADGRAESFATEIMNATGLALDAESNLYVSSRFDGTVHRITPRAQAPSMPSMGIATGIAFGSGAGNLYVGDRSGTIFKIGPNREIFVFATLEPSVAAYHLAGPNGVLYVTSPTTSSYDSIYAVDRSR